jgi:type II restriction enzyme
MRYALATWEVRDLLLIPSFIFLESAVIKRKPLAATARRAGWVGCNFALNRVPAEARIAIVTDSHIKDKIRQQLQVLRDLGLLIHLGRGEWRLP